MLKEILFLTTGNLHGWATRLISGLCADLENVGLTVERVALDQLAREDINLLLDKLATPSEDRLLITFNGRVEFPGQLPNGEPYKLGCRHLCWIVDNPGAHLQALRRLPPDTYIGVIDESHISALRWLDLDLQGLFVPHKPDSLSIDFASQSNRTNAVAVPGNIGPVLSCEAFKSQNPPQLHPYIEAACAAAETLSRKPGVVHDLFQDSCTSVGANMAELNADLRSGLLSYIESTGQNLARRRLIKALANHVEVDVFGDVANPAEFDGKTIYFHGVSDYETVLSACGTRQAVANVTPKYASGATERVWDALTQGALVLSTQTTQLSGASDIPGVRFIDLELDDEDLSRSLAKWVQGDALSKERARLADQTYTNDPTQSRAQHIVNYFSD
ncbi:hypothetical protein V5T82_12985 [Magnetovibrio sp. PR-2]|uniref:hypothetical protein n=1 Tax=Magnetovibrio sp. PR-2 TaxID=3120356 RepID=UPI002FCE38DC